MQIDDIEISGIWFYRNGDFIKYTFPWFRWFLKHKKYLSTLTGCYHRSFEDIDEHIKRFSVELEKQREINKMEFEEL